MALTTTTLVKDRLFANQSPPPTTFDTLIDTLITEAEGRIIRAVGHNVEANDYTHYLDGDGGCYLFLPEGPLNTVTSVHYVAYSDDGAGGREETPTEVEEWEYLLGGVQGEGGLGRGYLYRNAGWLVGKRNYKLVYNAGFTTVPKDLQDLATFLVIAMFTQRETAGQISRVQADAQLNYLSPAQVERVIDTAVAPYAF